MIDSTNPRILADNIRQLVAAGSGGSTVVPNPEGEVTGVLSSLGIDGSKFSIPQYTSLGYSTEEVDLGIKWIDGNEIYRKTFDLETAVVVSRENFTDVDSVIKIDDADTFIDVFSVSGSKNYQGPVLCERDSNTNHIQLLALRNGTGSVNCKIITFTYTKAAVTAQSKRSKNK